MLKKRSPFIFLLLISLLFGGCSSGINPTNYILPMHNPLDLDALHRSLKTCWNQIILKKNADEQTQLSIELARAAAKGKVNSVKFLVNKGAPINKIEDPILTGGRPPLVWAASMHNVDIVKLLLEHGADPNLADVYGVTALLEAAGWTAFNDEPYQGEFSILSIWWTETDDDRNLNFSPNEKKLKPILEDKLKIAEMLIKAGAEVNKTKTKIDETALTTAVCLGRTDMVKLLLENKANPTLGRNPAILEAVFWLNQPFSSQDISLLNRSHSGVALKLKLHDVGPKVELDIVDLLVKHGADVNITSCIGRAGGCYKGTTALMLAAEYCKADIVRYLLEHGADKELKDNLGNTALDWAKKTNCPEVQELLRNN